MRAPRGAVRFAAGAITAAAAASVLLLAGCNRNEGKVPGTGNDVPGTVSASDAAATAGPGMGSSGSSPTVNPPMAGSAPGGASSP